MSSIDPTPNLKHKDNSVDNSKQDIRVLNNASISNNQNTNISVSISNIGRRFREMPLWVQAVAAVIFLIGLYLAYRHFIEGSQKVDKLSSIITRDITAAGVNFKSASNSILNTIPNNIFQDNGPEQWSALSRIWMRSGATVNGVYSAAAECLKSGECRAGTAAKSVCRHAYLLSAASFRSFERLKKISGININMSGTDSILPVPTGVGEVMLPDLSNLFYVAKDCEPYGKDNS